MPIVSKPWLSNHVMIIVSGLWKRIMDAATHDKDAIMGSKKGALFDKSVPQDINYK